MCGMNKMFLFIIFPNSVNCGREDPSPTIFDNVFSLFSVHKVIKYAYPAPFLAGDCRQIEFISNGNLVTVPSSYVKRILVRMEGIYEK